VTVYGVADQPPSVPVTTSFGTQFNVITEERIGLQNSLDFYDALRNVPGVMFQKKNILGGQTSHSLYIRGRGASHPSPDLAILFDEVPRSGVLYGQALADGIPVYALGGMEVYKYPQPSRFGSGYGMVNFIPKYMTEEGYELRTGLEGGSYGTFAENVGVGVKKGRFDIYAAQSWISTDGHVAHSAGQQESYYVNTGFQAGEHWSLRFMSNYVSAETEVPNNPLTGGRTTDRYDTETGLTTLTLAHQYDQASGYVKGYYNDTNFYILGESGGTARSKQSNTLYGVRARETFSIWEGSEFVAGFDLDRMELENYNISYTSPPGPNNPRTWDFPDQTIFSPYVAVSQLFGDKDGFHILPSAGVRFYQHSVFKDKTSPQAGLVLGYGHTDLNFNYARGVNYPSPVVLQGFLANSSLPSGFDTEKIKPEVVDHYEVGLTHVWPGTATLSGTFFYDNGKDRTRAYMFGGAPNESFFNSTTSKYKIRGVELAGSVTPVEDLEIFAGATWLRAKATGDDGIERDRMPYTPDFAFQAGFKWDFLEHFRLSGDYQHLQGLYAGTEARTSATGNPASNFPKMTSLNRLPDIDVVNLRLDYLFDYEPLHIRQGKVFLAVNNVFDDKYAYALETNAGGDKGYYYMPGTNFMIGVDFTF
jgi:iron complex outermembrane receptor protein